MRPQRHFFDATHYGTAAANTAIVLTFTPANPSELIAIGGVWWSTNGGTPTSMTLKIEANNGSSYVEVYNEDITANGPGFWIPNFPRCGSGGNPVRVTLSAGGAGVVGKLWTDSWKESAGPMV
jgi:hypothetical protein